MAAVTLAEKHRQLVEDYSLIDDPQERLAAVVDAARRMPPLDAIHRTERNRVPGCVSQAWLVAEVRDGRCHFRADADSPLVRGLVKLLCDFYSGATPLEVTMTEPNLLDELGLARNLSATRLNGLRSVRAKIREFAAGAPP
ncbi:MAG TPA: SufE family protein [Lacunisphaera sp.]|nr:SufE family protein [Lacunisphaera sp.]